MALRAISVSDDEALKNTLQKQHQLSASKKLKVKKVQTSYWIYHIPIFPINRF